MIPDIPPEQTAIGTGLLAAIAYKAWQILKSDRRIDKAQDAEDKFRDDLLTEVSQLRTDLKLAHREQLESAKREAELKAEVKMLSEKVGELSKQISQMQNILEDYKKKLAESCDNCVHRKQ